MMVVLNRDLSLEDLEFLARVNAVLPMPRTCDCGEDITYRFTDVGLCKKCELARDRNRKNQSARRRRRKNASRSSKGK